MTDSIAPAIHRREWRISLAWFVILLGVHLYCVTLCWKTERLSGQEFRQTQTAISALFIQREHNFSLEYPTPVLGKPWSIPLEFPLYQWTAVVVSNCTGLSLVEAARSVTLACFYGALAAFYLLLGRLGLPPSRRLLALGLVLACPFYILYSRAFLIESMAVMFSLWYLVAFLAAMATRRPGWLLAANLLGILAATVKVTTFFVYLLPAAIWGGVLLWRARPRPGSSWRPFWDTAVRGLVGCALAPLLAGAAWVIFTDQVRELNIEAWFLNSLSMHAFIFGTWAQRFSADFWAGIFGHWRDALQPTAFTVGAVLVGLLLGGRRRGAWACVFAVFLGSQLMFSNLYLLHEYYIYASGFLLVAATGVAIGALLDFGPRFPAMNWIPWLLAAAVAVVQLRDYRRDFLPQQQLSQAGGEHTQLLRRLTDPDDVIVVLGDDWSSVIPYYTGRRALMITSPNEANDAYLAEAFAALKGERVGALVLSKRSQAYRPILERAEREFGILSGPAFSYNDDYFFYFNAELYDRVAAYLRDNAAGQYHQLKLSTADSLTAPRRTDLKEVVIASLPNKTPFDAMTPTPVINRNLWGVNFSTLVDNVSRFNAHAPSELVFQLSPGPHHLTAQFGIMEQAYLRKDPPNTDGVDFAVLIRRPHLADRWLFEKYLDPQKVAADRGLHSFHLNFVLPPGAQLILQAGAGPQDNNAFDWAYWGRVDIK